MKKEKQIKLPLIMSVGKYKGKKIKWIYDNDPEYLKWAWSEIRIPFIKRSIETFYEQLGSELLRKK